MAATLLFSVAGGMLAVLSTVRFQLIAWRFIRVVAIITMVLACLPTVWVLRAGNWSFAPGFNPSTMGIVAVVASAFGLTFAPVVSRMRPFFRIVCFCGGVCGIAAACLESPLTTAYAERASWIGALSTFNRISAALFLGAITVSWLLGHAYLTATKMTIAPLRHFSNFFSLAMIVRVMVVVGSLLVGLILTWTWEDSLESKLRGAWLLLSLRAGVGLVIVSIFAYMVADCVKLRATQSATGILYFGSLLAYVGELTAQYLTSETGWPM